MSPFKGSFWRRSKKPQHGGSQAQQNVSPPPVSLTDDRPGCLRDSQVERDKVEEHDSPPTFPNFTPPTSLDRAYTSSSLAHDSARGENGVIGEHLWTRAFELARESQPALMMDFETHLSGYDECPDNAKLLSSPQLIELAMKKLLDDRQKKQWHFSIKGRDIAVHEQVEKLAKFLVWSDGIVKQAISAQPYAALAWSGVSMLLPLLTSGPARHEEMVRGFNKICDIQLYWKTCEDTFLLSSYRQNYVKLIEPLSRVYSLVVEYQARSICHLSSRQLARAWQKVAEWEDWAAMEREIAALSDKCKDYIDALHKRELRDHVDRQLKEMQRSGAIEQRILQTLEASRQDEKETELLHFLASTTMGYEADKDFNPVRVDGTCEWFLTDEKFCNWRDGETSGLLWVSAGPGCGKSVLSRALINEGHLSTSTSTIDVTASAVTTSTAPDAKVCYFFFKDGDERRTGGAHALCAVLHQLFSSDPTNTLIKHALPSYKNHGQSLLQNFPELWRILTTCLRSPDGGHIICVFDALDECNERSRREMVDTLKQFFQDQHNQSDTSKLKVLITSRPYDVIVDSFTRAFAAQTTYVRFEGDDRSREISHDINMVIDARLPEVASSFGPEECRKLAERLKGMENRTYLWLHLTFNIIQDNPSEYSRSADIEDLLSSIPSEVSEAYEKILSKRKDTAKTETLLQIILAAVRPLTLDEANYALTLSLGKAGFTSHDEVTEGRFKKNFRTTVKNLCGLLVNVYDSQLFFIHQTAREFLTTTPDPGMKWKGRFRLPHSHAIISQSCLRYLLLPDLPGLVAANLPFLTYAAMYWTFHYRSQGAAARKECQNDARTLCRVSDARLKVWGSTYISSASPFDYFEDWGSWTDLNLASFLGLCEVVNVILAEDDVDVNMPGGHYGTALQAASAHGHEDVVRALLSKNANVNAAGGCYKSAAAAAARRGGGRIMALLLEERGDDIQITQDVLQQAARNRAQGKEILKLLIETRGTKVQITTSILTTATRNSFEVVELILGICGDEVQVTELMLYGAVYGSDWDKTIQLLLEHPGSNAQVTEDVLETILQIHHEDAAETVRMFLKKNKDKVLMTEGMLEVVAANSAGKDVMELLLEERGDEFKITQGVIMAVTENDNGKEMMELLLEKRGDEFKITENVFRGVVVNEKAMVELLIEKRGDEIQVTQDVFETATTGPYAKAVTELLLSKYGNEVSITEDVLRTAAAAPNVGSRREMMEFLLDKAEDGVKVTADVVQAVVKVAEGKDMMELLYKHRGDEIIITKEVMEAAAGSYWECAADLMGLLLKNGGDHVPITETMVQVAAGNASSGLQVMGVLLKERGDEIIITEGVLKAAAGNTESGRDRIELVLNERRNASLITEAVSEAAAANLYVGLQVMELLLKERGDEIVITEGVLKAAAGNWRQGKTLIKLLLKERGNEIITTESILKAAAGNTETGRQVIELLLAESGSDITVNEGILQTAAACSNEGVVDFLLEKRGNEIIITEDVLKAAAAADYGSQKLFELLLSAQGQESIVTEEVVKTGVTCGQLAFLDILYKKHHHQLAQSVWDEWRNIAEFYDAAKLGHLSRIKRLLAKGVNPDTKNARGQTPLWVAAYAHHIGVVQELAGRQDVDVNSVSNDGKSPLYHPAAFLFTRIVAILMKAGADPHLADKEGVSPMKAANDLDYVGDMRRKANTIWMLEHYPA